MEIYFTTINEMKQYVGKSCTFNYNGETLQVRVGNVTNEIDNISSIENDRSNGKIAFFTVYGNIGFKQQN